MMVSHFKCFHFPRQRGDEAQVSHHLTDGFTLLHAFTTAGRPMDAQMRGVYKQVRPMCGLG